MNPGNSPITVLLAEDDLDDQELLEEAFSSLDPNLHLLTFSSGKLFLQGLQSLAALPDMIILDYNIPEMNGAEILQQLRKIGSYEDLVKIVWSTSKSPLYENSCLASGAHAYFVKPSNMAGLTDLARKMISYIQK